jgi:hypothetical protein
VSLTLTWPLRLCLLRVLLGATTTVTSFPLSKHIGVCGATHTFSGQHVYLEFTWEVTLPPSPVEFSSHRQFYKLSCSGCWVCAATPAFSRRLVYLQFCEGFPSPPLWCSGHLALFAMCLFCCCCCLFSLVFFSFFPGWGSVCSGGYADLSQGCLWEYHMPFSSHCGLCLPKLSGCSHLAAWEPFWFLHLTWCGDAMHSLRVWRSQCFASSRWFFL